MNPLDKAAIVVGTLAVLMWAPSIIDRWLNREIRHMCDVKLASLTDPPPLPQRVPRSTDWQRLKAFTVQARADIEAEREFFAWAEREVSK